jgi:hypothetical protein
MAKLAQVSTEAPSAEADTAQERPETQVPAEGEAKGPSDSAQESIGTSTETAPMPTPTFTPQDYGVMLALVAAFVILIISLTGRRSG